MAEFKLVIGDPKTGKCHQIVVSGDNAKSLLGKKIGDTMKGEAFDFPGYEFLITGGADYCGFPMRKDIEGPVRKKVLIITGVGIRNTEKGLKKRKTVCGNTIHEKITQVSMKITKYGKKSLGGEEAAPEGDAPAEEAKPAAKEKPVETKKEEKTEEAPAKVEPKKEEAPKAEEKPKEKTEKKEETPEKA